jgi:hypothetical protein
MGTSNILTQAVVEFLPDFSKVESGLNKLSSLLGEFSWQKVAGMAAATAAPILAFVEAVSGPQGYATEMLKVDKWSRLGVGSIEKMSYAADILHADFGDVVDSMARLNIELSDFRMGGTVVGNTLDRMGLSAARLRGMDTYEQLAEISDAFVQIADPGKRALYVTDLFGERGLALTPILNKGGAAIRALGAEFEHYGIITDPRKWEEFEKQQTKMGYAFQGLQTKIAELMMPYGEEMMVWLKNITIGAKDWVQTNPEMVDSFIRIASSATKALAVITGISAGIAFIGSGFAPIALAAVGIGLIVEQLTGMDLGLKSTAEQFELWGADMKTWAQVFGNDVVVQFKYMWYEISGGFDDMFGSILNKFVKWKMDFLQAIDEVKNKLGLLTDEQVNQNIIARDAENKATNPWAAAPEKRLTWDEFGASTDEANSQLIQDSKDNRGNREFTRALADAFGASKKAMDAQNEQGQRNAGGNIPQKYVGTGYMVGGDWSSRQGAFYGGTQDVAEQQLSVLKKIQENTGKSYGGLV